MLPTRDRRTAHWVIHDCGEIYIVHKPARAERKLVSVAFRGEDRQACVAWLMESDFELAN
jgi:hypothetical protein